MTLDEAINLLKKEYERRQDNTMSKAVLISIRPEWCEKISSGKKTIEVRKTRPKIDTPFKCYIYCTKDNTRNLVINGGHSALLSKHEPIVKPNCEHAYAGNGKIIGEFVCNWVEKYGEDTEYGKYYLSEGDCRRACLTNGNIGYYAQGKDVYGWYISDLVIYDNPRELSEFCKPGERTGYKIVNDRKRGLVSIPFTCENESLRRPPQSWCYVEKLK